jgi:hypothetical protein
MFVLSLPPAGCTRHLCVLACFLPLMVFGAPEQTTTKKGAASERAKANPPQQDPASDSPQTRQQLERMTKATEKVLNRIQAEENDLYLRVGYFSKAERLNPNSYASKEEIAQWRAMLDQLKQKHDLVAQLYTDLDKDLTAELKATGVNDQNINRFKKLITDGFPWDTIEKKKQLIEEYVDEHSKLLTFYEKNWGMWKPATDLDKLEFTSASAANIYNKLRDQIVSTTSEIQKQYKEMSE